MRTQSIAWALTVLATAHAKPKPLDGRIAAVTGGARSPEDTRWASPPPTTCPVHQRVATEQECQAAVEAAKVGQP